MFTAGTVRGSSVFVICDEMSSSSPCPNKTDTSATFSVLRNLRQVVLNKGTKKLDVAFELQWLLSPELVVHLCVGVYSPQASRSNAIVFNALFTYP